jgi:NDP-sugar pyrophosphorylase family protein
VTVRGLAGVVLAAGAGTRLRPLTVRVPKALCPVGGRPLVDHALDRLSAIGLSGRALVAVNAHHHAYQVVRHVGRRATVVVEHPEALGTAGAIGNLRPWLDGRDALVTNGDAYVAGPLAPLLAGWDRRRVRLLVVAAGDLAPDFGSWRFAGASLLPAPVAARLGARPSGLYELVWRDAIRDGRAEFVRLDGVFVDCGTPADYLAANLHAARRLAVIGRHARVAGRVERAVILPGSVVRTGEVVVDAIRMGDVTVDARATNVA